MLPHGTRTPETTDGREGFIHISQTSGTAAEQYRNMRYWLEKDMCPVEFVREACGRVGLEPRSTPTRGGTGGSRLTEMGPRLTYSPACRTFTGRRSG